MKKGMSMMMNDGQVDNIFLHQAHINQMNQDVYSEKPRANLYNVIKKLRESSVSHQLPFDYRQFIDDKLLKRFLLIGCCQAYTSRLQNEG